MPDCAVCLSADVARERFFMPCKCRVYLCDECVTRVSACVYHRYPYKAADLNVTRLIQMNAQLSAVAEDFRVSARTLHGCYERMRSCAIRLSVMWALLSLLKDAAFVFHGTHLGLFVSVASLFATVAVLAHYGLVLPMRLVHRVHFWFWFFALGIVIVSKAIQTSVY
jgi:hypothetical protein